MIPNSFRNHPKTPHPMKIINPKIIIPINVSISIYLLQYEYRILYYKIQIIYKI